MEDWGFYPLAPFTVLSSKTFREEYPGRFSDSRIFLLLAPSHPRPFDKLRASVPDSGLMQVSSPNTAAGPSPTFFLTEIYGVPFPWILPLG